MVLNILLVNACNYYIMVELLAGEHNSYCLNQWYNNI